MRQFQSESQDYEREINELSHRYKLLNELKDKITQGKDSIMLILRLNAGKFDNTGWLLFIPDLAVEEVSHVFRAAFYS